MLPRALKVILCLWAVPLALALAMMLTPPVRAQTGAGSTGPTKTASQAKRAPTAQSSKNKKPPPKPRQNPAQQSKKKPASGAKPPSILVRPQSATQPNPMLDLFGGQMSAQGVIVEAQMRAQAENRRVLIVWGSDGDRAARAFVATLRSTEELRRVVLYEYELVLADVGDRMDRNVDIAAFYGAQLQNTGVPYLSVLAASQPLVHVHASYFSDGHEGYDAEKLLTFLRSLQPMAPLAEDVLQTAVNDARASRRLALVRFSSPASERARQIDAWFLRRDVRSSLTSVHQVRIDVERMIRGRDVLRRLAGNWETEPPWVALLDPQTGAVVASSAHADGRSWGDVGTAADLIRLRDLLRQAGAPQTDQQFELLLAPLLPATPTPAAPLASAPLGPTTAPAQPGPIAMP